MLKTGSKWAFKKNYYMKKKVLLTYCISSIAYVQHSIQQRKKKKKKDIVYS